MRWKRKPPKIAYGTTRVLKKILWFPLCLDRETRWLEYTKIQQKYIKGINIPDWWCNEKWGN